MNGEFSKVNMPYVKKLEGLLRESRGVHISDYGCMTTHHEERLIDDRCAWCKKVDELLSGENEHGSK